jgi:glutamyl/glutaminyl-tRNA synthetase
MEKIVVRIAPSPTGNLHIGTARTALFNFLFARQNNGTFIVRIEDTDKERSKKEYEDNILDGFKWLGISHDAFYRQSEREEIYKSYLKKLIEDGYAYISKEEVTEEGKRSEVIRFKNPNTKISFFDLIRGEVVFDTTDLGDFVIARSETEPLYHLAVVIDDHEMGVTHVIRGEDHISNTPRQILILGFQLLYLLGLLLRPIFFVLFVCESGLFGFSLERVFYERSPRIQNISFQT